MLKFFNQIINYGNRPGYEIWETYLTRKLNIMTLIAMLSLSSGIGAYLVLDYPYFLPDIAITLFVAPIVIILNRLKSYLWSAYAFYLIGLVFFFFLNLRMGKDSLMILFFFPFIPSTVLILGRRETLKHMVIILGLIFTTILFILVGFSHDYLYVKIEAFQQEKIRYINIILSFFVTISFIFSIVFESVKQETLIKNTILEKEVLLAEVFHRVKNNMNIVTSLLNLKKNATASREAKEALEECKNRVYSMALVHQNLYKSNRFTDLDLNEYIHDLLDELIDSNGALENVDAVVKCDEVKLDLSQAIPFGLILNELVTNSFKYARIEGKRLKINILVNKLPHCIQLLYQDNGPGLKHDDFNSKTLGLDLIRSLSEQLDGEFNFRQGEGFEFSLKIKMA